MLVFKPVSLLEDFDERSLAFSFEDDLDYKDNDETDAPER